MTDKTPPWRGKTHTASLDQIVPDGDGLRDNAGKPRFDLIPPEAMFELAKLYEIGSRKYDVRNWERGMSWCTCFSSLMRHAWKWMWGSDIDEETGVHHMIHVAWNAFALYTYATRDIGKDDRSVYAPAPSDS